MQSSMRARLTRRDAERFCARAHELALLDRVLGDADPPASVVLVHGPGGVGKSTLLREVIRRAVARGYRVATVDGREVAAESAALAPAVAALAGAELPLLVVDTYERIAALGGHLRDEVIAELPARTRVIVAGRAAPEAAWSHDGWDTVALELPLAALPDADARELLARRGVRDEETVASLVAWAGGLPLALAVGADAAIARPGAWAGRPADGPDTDAGLAATLLRRLAGDELDGADRDVLATAAIATAVDAQLLAAVVPHVDGDHAEAWVRGLSFAEAHGTRVTLHERVRAALRRDLVERDPGHERALRRAIADHLHDRALLGEPSLLIELAALIDDPVVRWGFTAASDRYRIDRVRDGDEAHAAAALGAGGTRWWSGVRRYLEEAPERVVTVRDATGTLAGLCIAVTPHSAPAWSADDPVTGPWLEDARRVQPDGNALVWRDAFDLTGGGDPALPVVALLNTAVSRLSGLPNVRRFYRAVASGDDRARHLSQAIGARRRPDLDAEDGERRVECHVVDHGPGGLIGTARALVHRDLGLAPPRPSPHAPPGAEAVRNALRAFHDPLALAASPLARGRTSAERAASVRRLLREATAAAFGDSADEQLQRAIVERGYLDEDGGHARAAHELHLSRTTYFRRLAAASSRVAELVLAELR